MEIWLLGHRTTDNGQRTTDNGQRTTDNGQRTTDNGQRTTDNGQRTTDNGQRTTGYQLQDVSLVAEPGQTVAIVGPTGAGKTTLVNMIGRFYDVGEGLVTIDGIDVRDVMRASLRSQMGVV